MKFPSFTLQTLGILALAAGLGLAFNANRPDSLPLVRVHEVAVQASPQDNEITLHDAAQLSASGQAVFVDARDASDYAQGHIAGALSLPAFSFTQDFPLVRDSLHNSTVITYCDGEHCELSRDLAEQLKAHGLRNVRVLKNGWTLWRDKGLPTATGQEPLLREPQELEHPAQESLSQETPRLEHAPQQTMPDGPAPEQSTPEGIAHPQEPAQEKSAPQEATPQEPLLQKTPPQESKPTGDQS
ncbi:MAG: hypothetical protein GXY42_10555 [Desulfovibrionales bacterium]|nr:hypothetical protein [Desulfovibrionales bacterium]